MSVISGYDNYIEYVAECRYCKKVFFILITMWLRATRLTTKLETSLEVSLFVLSSDMCDWVNI